MIEHTAVIGSVFYFLAGMKKFRNRLAFGESCDIMNHLLTKN